MEQVAAAFSHWLRSHGIEPADVQLVLRAKDDPTRHWLRTHLRADMQPDMTGTSCVPYDLRGLKIHGIGISISSLDYKA